MKQPGRLRRAWKAMLGGGAAALLVADLLLNGALGGDVNETISSRVGRLSREGSYVAKAVCVVLDTLVADHCAAAAEAR
jgi:hypothetical protein